jgi:histidinol-phosphate/aromatic aminotransferase/cobyric acid decarboxylase-like protein
VSTHDPRWDATLDDLEVEVAQLEFGLATGDLEQIAAAGPWKPPSDLPVLPIELAQRAMELADRMAAAEERARAVRGQLNASLNQLNTQRQANAAYVQHDAYQQ